MFENTWKKYPMTTDQEAELKANEIKDIQFSILEDENKKLKAENQELKNKNKYIKENQELQVNLNEKNIENQILCKKIYELEIKLKKYKRMEENSDENMFFAY